MDSTRPQATNGSSKGLPFRKREADTAFCDDNDGIYELAENFLEQGLEFDMELTNNAEVRLSRPSQMDEGNEN